MATQNQTDRDYCVVEKGLTYSCRGLRLSVGDTVELPPTYWMSGTWRAKVIALGRGSYDGSCREVVRRIPPTQLRAEERQAKITARGGLRSHKHKVSWAVSGYSNPRSPYEDIEVFIECSCEPTSGSFKTFIADLEQQKGWNVSLGSYSCSMSDGGAITSCHIRVRRGSLRESSLA
jgi:hypothetical protein